MLTFVFGAIIFVESLMLPKQGYENMVYNLYFCKAIYFIFCPLMSFGFIS